MPDYLSVPKVMLNWLHAAFQSFYSVGLVGQFIVFAPIVYFLARAIVAVFRGKNSTEK